MEAVGERRAKRAKGEGAVRCVCDTLLCGKRVVAAQEHTPGIFFGTGERLVLRTVNGTVDGGEVNQPLVEELEEGTCVAAADVKVDSRMARLHLLCGACEKVDAGRFARTDVDIARDVLGVTRELVL